MPAMPAMSKSFEYGLTPLGQTLSDPLVAICRWAMDHLPELQAAREAYSRERPSHRLPASQRRRADGAGAWQHESR